MYMKEHDLHIQYPLEVKEVKVFKTKEIEGVTDTL